MHHFPGYDPGLAAWVCGSSVEEKRALCATLLLLGDKSVGNRWHIPSFHVLQTGQQPPSLHRQRGARAESCLPEMQPFPLLGVFWGTVENSTPCHGLHARDAIWPWEIVSCSHLPPNSHWNTRIQHSVHHGFIAVRLAAFFLRFSLSKSKQY